MMVAAAAQSTCFAALVFVSVFAIGSLSTERAHGGLVSIAFLYRPRTVHVDLEEIPMYVYQDRAAGRRG